MDETSDSQMLSAGDEMISGLDTPWYEGPDSSILTSELRIIVEASDVYSGFS